jgi:hypothetical protein
MAFSTSRRRLGSLVLAAGALALLATAVVFLASASPAVAHDTCSFHPTDPSVACLKDNHTRVDACDRDSDGHVVWARVTYSNGSTVSFQDTNGANPGCGNYYPANYNNGYYIAYNICVQYEGCGQPFYRPGWGTPEW